MPIFNLSVGACVSVCVTFVIFTDCESCTRPISTNPGSVSAPPPTPRTAPSSAITSFIGSPFRPARFGCSPACGDRTLRNLRQPPRHQGQARIFTVGLTQYVLKHVSKKSAPYHVTQDDISAPIQRLGMEKITGHQPVRRRGGVSAVLYKMHWAGLFEPSWEREVDLQVSRTHI